MSKEELSSEEKRSRDAFKAETARRNKMTQDREVALTSSFKRCNLKKDYHDAKELEAQLLKTKLDGRFYSADLMNILFCIFDTILFAPSADDEGFREASPNVNQIFEKMRRIGAESVSGFAFLSSFKDLDNMFVIKVPRNPNDDELYHEYFIGIGCTNELRKIMPNYAYIFGAFKCLPPVLSPTDNKKLLEFCAHGDKKKYVNYIIYEKVEGDDMKKLSANCTFKEFFSWFIQLILAIMIGASECGFTHYDLHTENVIMRPWRGNTGVGEPLKSFWIPYKLPSGEIFYIKTNKIATMIDFGRSHIQMTDPTGQVEHFGVSGFEGYGAFSDVARPWYDIYKFLGFALFDMLQAENYECLDKALPLFQLIDDRDFIRSKKELYDMIVKEWDEYYTYSNDVLDTETEYTLLNYLEEIGKEYPREFDDIIFEGKIGGPKPKGVILDCEKFCPSASQIEKDLTGETSSRSSSPGSINPTSSLVERKKSPTVLTEYKKN